MKDSSIESLSKNSNVTTGKNLLVCSSERTAAEISAEERFRLFLILLTKSNPAFYPQSSAENTEVAIIEVGGTVGDIESQPFLESIRQFQHEKDMTM